MFLLSVNDFVDLNARLVGPTAPTSLSTEQFREVTKSWVNMSALNIAHDAVINPAMLFAVLPRRRRGVEALLHEGRTPSKQEYRKMEFYTYLAEHFTSNDFDHSFVQAPPDISFSELHHSPGLIGM